MTAKKHILSKSIPVISRSKRTMLSHKKEVIKMKKKKAIKWEIIREYKGNSSSKDCFRSIVKLHLQMAEKTT